MLRRAGLLVAVSAGNLAAKSGRNPGAGSAARTRRLEMNFLYAAYAATWIIHIVYLGILVRRYQRVSREIEELKKK
jgi:CcmD family protein